MGYLLQPNEHWLLGSSIWHNPYFQLRDGVKGKKVQRKVKQNPLRRCVTFIRISTDIENQGIQAVHTHSRSFYQTLSYCFENRTFSESISHNLRVM